MQYISRDKEFYKKAIAITIPMALQSMITIGINLADTVMVGKLGEDSLSGVAQANQFVGLFQICCMGIGMGANVLTSRFWGMKKITDLKRAVTIMYRFLFVLSLLIFIIPTIVCPNFILGIYAKEPEVISEGVRYIRWMIPCYLLQGLALTSSIVLRSVGKVRIPLYSSIGAFFLNIFCNWVFIFGKFGAPCMGVEGAGVGTLISRVFEFCFICGYMFVVDRNIGYRVKDLFMGVKDLLGDYFRISIPVFVSDTLLALGTSAVAIVMGRIGKEFVSANSITVVTQQLSTVLIQGICNASGIMTGHTLGAGDKEKATTEAWTFLFMSAIVGIVGGGIILLIAEPVIGCYNITEETHEIASQLMRSIAVIVVFQSMNSILTKGVLRAGGDTKFLMVADILFLWVVSVPLGAVAGLYWHMDAFWIYFFLKIDQVIKSVWCLFRLKSGKWIKNIEAKS